MTPFALEELNSVFALARRSNSKKQVVRPESLSASEVEFGGGG